MDTKFIEEVEDALKLYRRADQLSQHKAADWPAVRLNRDRHANLVTVIRGVLKWACDQVEAVDPRGKELVRRRYMDGQEIEAIYRALHLTEAGFHRQRKHAMVEIATVIAEENRRAERHLHAEQHFPIPLPVFGIAPLVARLVDRLRDPEEPPILVLEGMGGLGKTTVARLVAQAFVDDETFAAVLWTSAKQADFDHWAGKVRPTRGPVSVGDIVRDLARQLRIDVPGSTTAIENEVRAHLRRIPYLVVVDNLETVADMEALAPFVASVAGTSRIMITTRDRATDALPATLPRAYVMLDELDLVTSMKLLRKAATLTNALSLAQASDAELARIYAVTGGNPLALWLVAGQAHGRPWSAFLRELAESCPRNSKGDEIYDYLYRRSWEQLSLEAREVLFAMHRCENGAEIDLIQELSALPEPAFAAATEELTSRMLLFWDGLYRIHRLTYTFL